MIEAEVMEQESVKPTECIVVTVEEWLDLNRAYAEDESLLSAISTMGMAKNIKAAIAAVKGII